MLHTISRSSGRYAVTPARFKQVISCSRRVTVTMDDGYAECFPILSSLEPTQAAEVIVFPVVQKVGLVNDWDRDGELAGRPLMGWDQVKELSKKGVRFGSHGATHVDLRKLGNQDLEREIRGSRQTLEDKLGTSVADFCYPYGLFDEQTIAQVKRAGYSRAFTSCDSIWQGFGNPLRTRRIEIKGTDPEWLVSAKLSGLYDLKAAWELPILLLEKLTGKRFS